MPHIHFFRPEFDRRLAAARASLEREGLDGLVLFRQDSMYYLTGYETVGSRDQVVFEPSGSRSGAAHPLAVRREVAISSHSSSRGASDGGRSARRYQ